MPNAPYKLNRTPTVMTIKCILGIVSGAACLALGQSSLQAQSQTPDLLVYKVSRTSTWRQAGAHYDYNLANLKGRNSFSGTLTENLYLVMDRTSKTMRVVEYYTITGFKGAKKKLYSYSSATFGILGSSLSSFETPPQDEFNPLPHFMDTMLLSGVKPSAPKRLNWRGGFGGINDPEVGNLIGSSGEAWFMEGTAAPVTLAPGLIVPDVARSLVGQFEASNLVEEYDQASGNDAPPLRAIEFRTDTGKQTATLDIPLTLRSRTVLAPGSLAANNIGNALATVITALENIGYDLDVPSIR